MAAIGHMMGIMHPGRNEHDIGQRRVGWLTLLLGAVATVFGARDIIGYEPLPAVMSPDNILAFLDAKRYFGVWPGVVAVMAGIGFLAVGLLVLMGFVVKPSTAGEEVRRSSVSK